MWLTRFAIQRPTIVTMFFIGLLIFGLMSYAQLGRSLTPNVTFPVVVVAANYPGASPAEMERLIIKPIEDQIDGIDNLDKMSATAQEGRGVVVVQFKLDTNLDFAAIDIQRRVDTARVYMPTDLDPPTVDKSAGSQQAPILTIALSSKSLSATALSDLVHDRIVPDIKHIPNINNVDVRGNINREFHVDPIPQRLLGTNATLPDIASALSSNNANLPGGHFDSATNEASVSIHADIVRASDMLSIPLVVPGGAQKDLRIGDVANVSDSHVEKRIVSKFKGLPTIILDVNRLITADEITSTNVARAALVNIEKKYPMVNFEEVDAPAEYTQASLNGVMQSLIEGIALTAIVLLLFLHAWRNAIVVMIAIPSSLLATFVVSKWLGFTLDEVSLMGLSLTIGILVDDSIVVLENITRHRDLGQNPTDAAISGRSEIGGAAVAITLVDIVVFLPIAFLSGIVGKFMKEFGIVIVTATMFSLFVSFTLTPMLAARWSVKKRSTAPPRYLAWFQTFYNGLLGLYHRRLLPFALDHRGLTMFICALLVLNALSLVVGNDQRVPIYAIDVALAIASLLRPFIGSGWRALRRSRRTSALVANGENRPRRARRWSVVAAACPLVIAALTFMMPKIGTEFIPSEHTGDISMTLSFPTGTPLATTQSVVDKLEAAILKVPGVANTITTTGTKPSGFGSSIGGNFARMHASMEKNRRREDDRAVQDIRNLAYIAKGAVFTVATQGGGSGGDQISFTLQGPESKIDGAANRLAAYIRSQKGTVNVQTGAESEGNRLNINVDRARCALLGISPGAAATAARIAIGGAVATRVRTEQGLVDVRVQLPEQYRNRLDEVQNIRVRANDGSVYRLGDVAAFEMTRAPTKIERLDKERVVRVSGGIDSATGVKLGDVTGPIATWLATPGNLPSGVESRASGDSQFIGETFSSMGIAILTSFALVYMLMVILYGSFMTPLVVMFSVPLALVGALVGLSLSQQTFNLFSLIAIIMLFGLVAKNGILLVDYANTLRHRGMQAAEAMVQAAETRFRPILMTTMAMVFGMLPLALGLAEGAEIRRSMGTVLIGGLISSLILTLFLVPVIYTKIMAAEERREARRTARALTELPEFEAPAPVGAH